MMSAAHARDDYSDERAQLVREVEATYAETASYTGLRAMSPAVREALGRVERHRFVSDGQRDRAYRNHPLPIGAGQTISQPYIVALSTDLIEAKPGDTVLEVGTGSGYQAAMLASIVAQVYSIELIGDLGREAAARLKDLGYANVEVRIGDGYAGWPEKAPFDGIVVTAAAPRVPEALVEQLAPGGRMVIPVGERDGVQELVVLRKRDDGSIERRNVLPVRFVPLVPGDR
jgi:protein-L-isoaspartate(D-aspartate) O-methyltransferase